MSLSGVGLFSGGWHVGRNVHNNGQFGVSPDGAPDDGTPLLRYAFGTGDDTLDVDGVRARFDDMFVRGSLVLYQLHNHVVDPETRRQTARATSGD